jgi:chromosome partitioning protein
VKNEKDVSQRARTKPPPTKGIVVLGNLKGGCGKSTVVFNLAVWLATAGNRPILVDLDPQRTLSDLVAVREEIGALPALDAPLHELPRLDGGLILVDQGAGGAAGVDKVLPEADLILVPVLPSQADIWATQRYLKMALVRRKTGARIALFINRAEPADTSRETREAQAALKAMAAMCEGAVVLPATLGRRIAYCRSLSEGLGVFEIRDRKAATEEFGRLANATMAML